MSKEQRLLVLFAMAYLKANTDDENVHDKMIDLFGACCVAVVEWHIDETVDDLKTLFEQVNR